MVSFLSLARRLVDVFFSSLLKGIGTLAVPAVGAATGGIGSALVSGGLSLLGGVMANNSAKNIAKDNNAVSIDLSNTAHQREVKDLLAAGLNPILSANSGASVPNMQAAPVQNVLESVGSSARAGALISEQIKNIKADTAQKEATATAANAQTTKVNNENTLLLDTMPFMRALSMANAQSASAVARSNTIQADLDSMGAKAAATIGANLNSAGSLGRTAAEIWRIMRPSTAGASRGR